MVDKTHLDALRDKYGNASGGDIFDPDFRAVAQSQFKGKFKLGGFKMTNENYGIGVKKGSDLKAKINKALEEMVSDGSWKAAVTKNFGPADYKNEPAPKIGDIKS